MYENITAESIKQNILGAMQTDVDKREGSYTSNLVAPASTELWKIYTALNALLPIAFVDKTSGEYIDKRTSEVGITRKPGTKAHVQLTLTGDAGTTIPAGMVFLTLDGLEYVTAADVLMLSGAASVEADAADVGESYNVPAGSIVNQYNSIAGLSAVTNQQAAIGGTDPETDESLVDRYYAYLQKPPTSGNVHDYEKWALEVNGVGAVKVTPLQYGPGTVGVLIVGPQKQPVDKDVVTACAIHIEEERPVGATVTVASASALSISVTAKVTTDGSVTPDSVQASLMAELGDYLKSIAFKSYTVLYNHVGYLLLGIVGVSDYTGLTVNGGTVNVSVSPDQVPVLGTVEVGSG